MFELAHLGEVVDLSGIHETTTLVTLVVLYCK
uniref:Uncharacterized protein n=1 Tax=Arundo donax TaxID=35708 RepID=A0A0A9B4C6_ARUDO